MKSPRFVAALSFMACMGTAQAVTIFSDDFNADTVGLNKTSFLGGWTVTDGTVDLVDFVVGRVIDLDGSSGDAGLFSKSLSLTAGVQYTASFALAGSQRGSSETALVSFGGSSDSFTLASSDGLGLRSLLFTPTVSGDYALSFANEGGDNVGLLLDDVTVTSTVAAIPEPQTYALLLAGLGLVGLARRAYR